MNDMTGADDLASRPTYMYIIYNVYTLFVYLLIGMHDSTVRRSTLRITVSVNIISNFYLSKFHS